MNQDDSKIVLQLVEICDAFVQQHAAQIKFAKATQLRFENIEAPLRLLAQILKLPEGAQKNALLDQVLILVERSRDADGEQQLSAALAKVESDHEKIEHVLSQLRASLQ
jgi:hypothetical protein